MGKKIVREGFSSESALPAPDAYRSNTVSSSKAQIVQLVMIHYGPEIAGEQVENHSDAQANSRRDVLQGHLTKTGTVDFVPQRPELTDTRVENNTIAGAFSPSSVSVASLVQSAPGVNLSSNGYTN